MERLEEVVKADPNLGMAELVLSQVYLRDKEYDKALEAGRAMAAKDPKNPFPHNLMALAWLGKGDRQKARAELEKALELKPDFITAHLNLARLDASEGKADGARRHYLEILKIDPKHESAMLGLARLEEQAGNKEKALEWIRKAHEASPQAVRAGILLVRHYLASGEPLKALPVARILADANPNNPAALETLAMVQVAAKDTPSAIGTYEALARLKPVPDVYARIGQLRLTDKDVEGARKAYEKALAADPRHLPSLTGMAAAELLDSKLDAAARRIAELRKAHPDSPLADQLEGDLARQKKDMAGAARAYAESYRKGPTVQRALLAYETAKKAGDAKGALAMLQKALQQFPKAPGLHLALAGEYLEAGRYDEAVREYERVQALSPDNVLVLNNLAWLYQQKGELDKALELGRRAKDKAPGKPEILDTYGWIAVQAGKTAEGLEALEQAAVFGPHIPSIQYHLAVAQEKAGKADAARKTLRRLLKSGKAFPEQAQAKAMLQRLGG